MINNKVVISGANGYLGRILHETLLRSGHIVRPLIRSDSWQGLGHLPKPSVFEGSNSFIHCAWDFKPGHELRSSNGSIMLLKYASQLDVKNIINISSLSAFPNCKTLYGQAKHQVEVLTRQHGCLSIRCGLLWHPQYTGGILGNIRQSVIKNTIIPIIGHGRYPQFMTQIGDLCKHIEKLIASDFITNEIISFAEQKPVLFNEIISHYAKNSGKTHLRINVPWPLLYYGAKACESLRIKLPFRSDSILGLVSSTTKILNHTYPNTESFLSIE
jgi:nucleoside-diphosphate-sugar epimerase